jgi:hypothetical protein
MVIMLTRAMFAISSKISQLILLNCHQDLRIGRIVLFARNTGPTGIVNSAISKFYDILSTILDYDEGESCTDGGTGFSRLIFLRGQGGSGKSTCVNAARAQLDPGDEAVMATTGKAATVIGGSTV